MPEPDETPPSVRQRNTTPYDYNVAETKSGPAYLVRPGETAEFPALLDGWTPVDEDEPAASGDSAGEATPAEEAPSAEADAEPPTPKKATPSRRRATAADTEMNQGGESR